MTSIITGDIIESQKVKTTDWIDDLKELLNHFGQEQNDWEIYRGDSFQIEIKDPKEALWAAIRIKAYLKSRKMDARMGIGIGSKPKSNLKISERSGKIFINAGQVFDSLKKEKITMGIKTDNSTLDETLNLMLQLALTIMDNWPQQSAEYVFAAIENPTLTQKELGLILNIQQASVSRRSIRSHFDLIMKFESFYRATIEKQLV